MNSHAFLLLAALLAAIPGDLDWPTIYLCYCQVTQIHLHLVRQQGFPPLSPLIRYSLYLCMWDRPPHPDTLRGFTACVTYFSVFHSVCGRDLATPLFSPFTHPSTYPYTTHFSLYPQATPFHPLLFPSLLSLHSKPLCPLQFTFLDQSISIYIFLSTLPHYRVCDISPTHLF